MDWSLAITRNRNALRRIVAALFALAGLGSAGSGSTLPRHVYCAVMLVLRPAESAMRRLIFIAARGMVLKPQAARAFPAGISGQTGAARMPAFCLLDPLRDPLKSFDPARFTPAGPPPRISVPGFYNPLFVTLPLSSAQDRIDAGQLGRRLSALQHALDNLPKQARRLLRWQAQRDLALKSEAPYRPRRLTPFRPGTPPGCRTRFRHEVNDVLRECHTLAYDAMDRPDSS